MLGEVNKMNEFSAGIGLRTQHFPHIENRGRIRVDWFEAISENFIDTRGRPFRILEKLRQDFPIALHGVSLNIASSDNLDFQYLEKLKSLYQIIDPFVVSDHMCWTGFNAHQSHDLLPLPRTKEFLQYICEKIEKLQEFMGREFAFENLSAYFDFEEAEFTEAQFINEICERTGSKMLLDINNVFVNAKNFSTDPMEYFRQIDFKHVVQLHIASYSDKGQYLYDTHSGGIYPDLIEIFKKIAPNLKSPKVLMEWDQDIPGLPEVENEVFKLKSLWERL